MLICTFPRLYFLFQIQMQEGKENQFSNFSKLLKKLEIDNVAIPELRQLKQEHAYLQKLRYQRTKIEQLKTKHDHAQAEIKNCYNELAEHKQLIQDQHKTIKMLEDRLQQSQQKRSLLENNMGKTIELEREKQKHRINQLVVEIERVKQEAKKKDLALFEMEDEIQNKTRQYREQLQQQRKKIFNDCQQKINSVLSDKKKWEQENQELKELVTRQHKALQLQNEQYQECSTKNEELAENISSLEEQLDQALKSRVEAEEQVAQIAGLLQRMEGELSHLRTGQNAKDQVEQLRKRVSQLAKGEIERIQFIVNEFE